jgi:hypothetical protein
MSEAIPNGMFGILLRRDVLMPRDGVSELTIDD